MLLCCSLTSCGVWIVEGKLHNNIRQMKTMLSISLSYTLDYVAYLITYIRLIYKK